MQVEVLGCQVDYYKRVCVHKPDQIVYQDTKLFPCFACLGAMKEASLLSQAGYDHGNVQNYSKDFALESLF